ncbi:hypothetical protein SDC9_89794 [bioreactor metagenome]|uniref:Uncharacterized protein n=1 Tax=bioreactor metagenome TaxID=1076179 RepID=A0A644ZT96_9ZZZZ
MRSSSVFCSFSSTVLRMASSFSLLSALISARLVAVAVRMPSICRSTTASRSFKVRCKISCRPVSPAVSSASRLSCCSHAALCADTDFPTAASVSPRKERSSAMRSPRSLSPSSLDRLDIATIMTPSRRSPAATPITR